MLRAVRSFFTLLKSSRTPDQIAVGASIGILIGLTPLGGHTAALVALTLILQCSFRAMLLTALLSTPFAYLIAVPCYRLGVSLLEGSEMCRALAAWLNDWPLLALSGWHRYWMFGSAVAAPAAAAAAYVPLRMLVLRYRSRWAPRIAQSGWYQKSHQKRGVRALHWLFLGGAGPRKEPKVRAIWNPARYVRWTGVVAVFVLLIGTYAVASVAAATVVPAAVESNLAQKLGAPVTVESAALDPFSWTLTVDSFRIPDPNREGEDLAAFGRFSAQIRLIDLLALRVTMDHIRLEDVAFHVRREADGSLNLETIDPDIGEDRRAAWREWLDWLKEHRDADWNESIARLRELMGRVEEVVAAINPRDLPFDRSAGTARQRLQPMLQIGEVAVVNLDLSISDERPEGASLPHLTRATARVRNVVYPNPQHVPMAIEFDGGLSASAEASMSARGSMQDPTQNWTLNLDAVPLSELRGVVEEHTGLRIENGFALSATQLNLDGEAIDATVNLALARLSVSAQEGVSLFGLDASLTPHVVRGINLVGERAENIAFAFFVRGTLSEPRFDWNVNWLEIAKLGLESLGEAALQGIINQIGGQIEALSPEHIVAGLTGDFADMETTMQTVMGGEIENLPDQITGDLQNTLENLNPLGGGEGEGDAPSNPLDNILGGDNPLDRIMGEEEEETPNPLDRINPFGDDPLRRFRGDDD